MIQLSLIQDTTIKKTIKNLPIEQLSLSEFNPRQTRKEEQINKLATRISKNGFEITRALWVYQNGQGHKVFAGGTRLEAAKRAGCKSIPCVVHDGVTEEDIARLAYEDNENDDYHESPDPVEIWANYAMLKERWGTEEKVAEVLSENRTNVNFRLRFHALDDRVKTYVTKGSLKEANLREIIKLLQCNNLEGWVTTQTLQFEIAKQSADKKAKSEDTANLVTKLKEVIKLAQDHYSQLSPDWQPVFVELLAKAKARSKSEVQAAYNQVVKQMTEEARRKEEELARQQGQAEADRIRLEREQERNARIEAVLANIHHGDFREVCKQMADNSIDAIITDAPYPEEYLPLYEALAQEAARILKPGGSLLVMCGQSYLPQIFASMLPHLNYHWTLSYLTPGGQSPQIWPRKINTFWKPVLWFVKGEYQGDWHGDVIKSDVNDNDKRFHDWGQSESGTRRLVENFSQPGDVVLDPFCGGGTTGLVAIATERRFVGIDTDRQAVQTTRDRLLAYLNEVM